jgi:hypothetical protein
MHCPTCGQQQVSEVTRFCSRCGFPLDGVAQLLASGGVFPAYSVSEGSTEKSARWKGVRQGMMLFLLGVLLVPILGVFSSYTGGFLSRGFEMLAALFALLCFVGGPIRMLFAALFEEGAPRHVLRSPQSYMAPAPAAFAPPNRVNVLPPAAATPVGGWRRPNTAELVNRPSVTENTTRLLDKNDQDPGK